MAQQRHPLQGPTHRPLLAQAAAPHLARRRPPALLLKRLVRQRLVGSRVAGSPGWGHGGLAVCRLRGVIVAGCGSVGPVARWWRDSRRGDAAIWAAAIWVAAIWVAAPSA